MTAARGVPARSRPGARRAPAGPSRAPGATEGAIGDADLCRSTAVFMDTLVCIDVVHGAGVPADCTPYVARAFERFREVEERCTRFDPDSELMRLCRDAGAPHAPAVSVSDVLARALACALSVADASAGAFDPTVGRLLESHGFDEHYRTGAHIDAGRRADAGATYRDVHLDVTARAVTLDRPLVLDLGAVAKGLAIDLAAAALRPLRDFAIDAGGDLYLSGRDATGDAWPVGLRDPFAPGELLDAWRVSDGAVCTSGDYERRRPGGGHHIVDPESGRSAAELASVTVAAPTAMEADALATAAFVLGARRGVALLERWGVDGVLVGSDGARHETERVRAARATARAA